MTPKTIAKLPQHAPTHIEKHGVLFNIDWTTARCQVSCDHKAQGNWDIVGAALENFNWNMTFPIGSMGLVYLPTWMVDFYNKSR